MSVAFLSDLAKTGMAALVSRQQSGLAPVDRVFWAYSMPETGVMGAKAMRAGFGSRRQRLLRRMEKFSAAATQSHAR